MKLHENFVFNVYTVREGRRAGLMGGHACSIGELFDKVFNATAFYLREGDGYDACEVEVEHACAACLGRGTVAGTRKMVACKACKGAPTAPYFRRTFRRSDLHDCHLAVVDTRDLPVREAAK